jgi:uncharacterized phage-associated protein
MINPFEFDTKVAVEAILLLANKSQDPTFHHIVKLLYFADRLHLQRYGRLICGDDYVAMKHGPVPSGIYDMLKAIRDGHEAARFPELSAAFQVKGYTVIPLRNPDLEWLSDSDIECLTEAIDAYDTLSFHDLTALSHDEAWQSADPDDFISLEAIVRSVGNPNQLLKHLKNLHP